MSNLKNQIESKKDNTLIINQDTNELNITDDKNFDIIFHTVMDLDEFLKYTRISLNE